MPLLSPKIWKVKAKPIEAVALHPFQSIFCRFLIAQIVLLTCLYLLSVYVHSNLSLHYQLYAQIPVIVSVLIIEHWLFKKLNIIGRLKGIYSNGESISPAAVALCSCVPVLAIHIFYLAATRPEHSKDSAPWWFRGGLKTYCALLFFYFLLPISMGSYLQRSESLSTNTYTKFVSYLTLNPTGYVLVHLSCQLSELEIKSKNWKKMNPKEFSKDLRTYADEADLNGTGMIILFAKVVTFKIASSRTIASADKNFFKMQTREDLLYLGNVFTKKATHLGHFNPLMVVSSGAIFEASLITLVSTFINLAAQSKLIDLLNKFATSSEARGRGGRILASQMHDDVKNSVIFKHQRDLERSWLGTFYR